MMKLDSPWFDGIRAAKKVSPAETKAKRGCCDHPDCEAKGEFKAPKGRDNEGQYWNFCFEHVRQYNQSFNYFRDMPDDAVQAWQKDSLTGHRPTWTMGVNKAGSGSSPRPHSPHPRFGNWDFADPFNIFGKEDAARAAPKKPTRTVKKVEQNALTELGVDEYATGPEIKARFKTLVKRLHPDANGGDRGTEDKLRAVIQAYNYLKQAGLC